MTQKFYFIFSFVCLMALMILVGLNFEQVKSISISVKWLGPGIVFFCLTYLSDVFLYFYYLKNSHLNPQIRYRILLSFRILFLILVSYFLFIS